METVLEMAQDWQFGDMEVDSLLKKAKASIAEVKKGKAQPSSPQLNSSENSRPYTNLDISKITDQTILDNSDVIEKFLNGHGKKLNSYERERLGNTFEYLIEKGFKESEIDRAGLARFVGQIPEPSSTFKDGVEVLVEDLIKYLGFFIKEAKHSEAKYNADYKAFKEGKGEIPEVPKITTLFFAEPLEIIVGKTVHKIGNGGNGIYRALIGDSHVYAHLLALTETCDYTLGKEKVKVIKVESRPYLKFREALDDGKEVTYFELLLYAERYKRERNKEKNVVEVNTNTQLKIKSNNFLAIDYKIELQRIKNIAAKERRYLDYDMRLKVNVVNALNGNGKV